MVANLFSLSWDDIIFPSILPLLSYTDWLSLRCTSRLLCRLIKDFFSKNRALHHTIPSERIFRLMTKDSNSQCLRVLVLSNCTWVTDAHLRDVLKICRKLKKIDLTNCSALSQGILQLLTKNCEELEEMYLGGCGWVENVGLEYHQDHHARLKNILADPSSNLDPLAIFGKVGLRTLPPRKKSKFSGKDDLFSRLSVPDEPLKIYKKHVKMEPVVRRQGSLKVLDLSKNYALADNIFDSFFETFDKITHLYLAEVPALTDRTMKNIAVYLKDLVHLDISLNLRITDKGLVTVGRFSPNLKSVNVIGCIGITSLSTSFLRSKQISVSSSRRHSTFEGSADIHPMSLYPTLPKHLVNFNL